VDGFDQEEDTSESDESGIVSLCFLTSHGHAFETLDLADQLLDPGAQLVEPLGEEFRSVLGRASMRNDRDDPSAAGSLAVGLGVVSLVGDGGPRRHVRANIEERFELAAVAGLVAGEMKVERQAVEVAFDVDLGAEAAARPAERLVLLPPFAPAAETCARIEVLSNIWMMPAVRLQPASA
jgi:hypothetical protein